MVHARLHALCAWVCICVCVGAWCVCARVCVVSCGSSHLINSSFDAEIYGSCLAGRILIVLYSCTRAHHPDVGMHIQKLLLRTNQQ